MEGKEVFKIERITHYHGRRGLEKKLHRLFTDFRFTSMRKLIEQFKWEESPVEIVDQEAVTPQVESNSIGQIQSKVGAS